MADSFSPDSPAKPTDSFQADSFTPDQAAQTSQDPRVQALQNWANQHKNDSWADKLTGSLDKGYSAAQGIQGPNPFLEGIAPPTEAGLSVGHYLMGSGPKRVMTSAAQGAASAGLHGQSPIVGGIAGAGAGLLGETISGLQKFFGGKLSYMTPEQVEDYVRDPAKAEELHDMMVNDPLGLQNQSKSEIESASENLQKKYIDPRMAKLSNSGGDAASIRVKPEQFKDTEAYPVIKDVFERQGNTIEVPVSERVRSTQVSTEVPPSTGKEQTVMAGDPYYTKPFEMKVSAQEPIQEQWAPQQDAPDTFTPVGTQEIPAPMPESVNLTQGQALRARRAASRGSGFSLFGKTPAETAVAQANSKAATNLGKAIEGISPGSEALDEEIHQAIVAKKAAGRLSNPSRIYNSSETEGSVPIRSLQQFLDENAGSNFAQTGASLEAGKAMNAPLRVHGNMQRMLSIPAGRAAVKTLPAVRSIFGGSSETASPVIRQAILDSLFGNQSTQDQQK